MSFNQMWADNTIVVGVAGSNPNNYTVKVEPTIGDGGTKWGPYELTKAGITFEGKKLYVGTFNEKYGGVDNLDLHYYNGGTWKEKKTPYSSWTNSSTFQNRIFNYDASGAKYSDVSMKNGARVYFDASTWEETGIKLVTGHANHQKYYTLSAVTNTKLYYGTNTDTWSDAMGFGIVGGTSRSGGNDQWLTDVSDKAAEYTGWKNYGLTSTSTNNAYLVVPGGKAGEQPTINYYATAYSSLNSTQTIKYAVGVNGGTPAELTSGYVPADIAISSYKFASGTYNSVSPSSGSVTLSKGGSNYSATVTAARTATTTYTVSNIHEDYSFVGWYSAPSGGTLLSSELSYTFYPTSATTAYARFSKENNHTVTIIRYCTSTTSEINRTSAKIGEVTYSSIEAPDIQGYAFVNWSLGSGLAKHGSDALAANPIRVKTNDSGSGYTLTANYTEVLTTDWKLIGDNTTNSPFGDGYSYASGKAMSKKSGASATDKAYKTLDITHTGTWGFKVASASGSSYTYGWGTGSTYITFNRAKSGTANDVYTGEQHELKFNPDALGEYEFEVDYTAAKCSVKVTFPTAYAVTFDKGSVNGTSGSISATYSSVSFSSGTKIQSGKRVTLVAPNEKTGYTWYGWCTNANGSGRVSTNKTYSPTISAATTLYACYTINNYAITHSDASHGSYTIQVGDAAAVSANTTSDYGKQITLAATPATGYHFGSWSAYKTGTPATTVTVTSNKFTMPDYAVTVGATFSPNTYTVHFHRNGGAGDVVEQNFTYDVAQNLTANTYTRTGYTFAGWALTTDGAVTHTDGAEVSNLTSENGATFHLYAKWTANNYTVVLDKQTSAKGYGGNEGTVANQTVTFDATPATVSGTMPTAAQGYGFMGFYSAENGEGRQFINPSGEWVTSAGDTISGGKWVKPAGITLYAYYKKAEITALTLVDAIVAPDVADAVKVTPTVEPTPAGTTHIDWRVLYSNGNPLASQPSMSVYNTTGVQFTSPATSGTYLIEAVLRTGSTAKAGTTIDSTTVLFHVAGDHTVTVQYKDAEGATIAASTNVTGKPLAWSDDITAPTFFGYSFTRWDAGDGVTIKDGSGEDKTTSTSATIKIKAVYDGRLTAVYNKKSMIYFKNTLGWSNVYFHKSYWDNSQGGAGNKGQTRNRPMSLVPGETDIYYWEGTPGTDVAFTNAAYGSGTSGEGGYQAFWAGGDGAAVVFPSNPDCSSSANTYYGYNAGTPMFVPIAQEGQEFNKGGGGKAVYYNKGYWRYYDPVNGEEGATGYTLKIYNKTEDAGRVELSSTSFTNADVTGQLFKATVNLEAAGGYGVKILRNNSMLYTNTTGHLHRTGDVVVTERGDDNYQAIWIKATAAGDYDFIITCNGDGKICLQATFPAKNGDYRVLYTDNATWSNSAHTAQTWFHPSRVISAEANAEDTISFYVAKGNTPQYKIEKITEIYEGTGAITWTQVQDWTDISVAATGVYNFKITQNAAGDGISSVENLGEYTGNYYIRTDCAGSTKWDNYKSNDHMMTYSEYSKDHSDYTHYYMKFVKSGTNVKFCIANDYSDCISDTLITHTYRGGDASHVYDSDGVGYKKGDIKADANVRFMWDIRYNKLIRAYLARGKNNGSKFLVLCGQAGELLAPDGSPLTGDSEANPGNNHGGGANNMQFVDNENWIYEANVKIVPNSYVKLTALFHGSTFYFKGSEGAFDAGHAIQLMTGSGSAELVRVIYDFKTDRLLAAWQPSGNISTVKEINADVMFVREHQGDITQLTFSKGEGEVMGAITKIETAYAVLRFNKWTINNKSKADGHAPLSPLLSRYERDLFYVSFPFRVSMNEVFGFGTYGKHWIIEEYDGATRAAKGYWAESAPNWKFIWDRKGKFFEPNQGYIIALELDEMGEESDVWANGVQNVELYFPSYGTMGDITNASVTYEIPEHECTINRSDESNGHGGTLGPQYDRRVKDSHWNVISVPTYVNTDDLTFANTTWITTADDTHVGPNFLYEWNSADNSVTARSGVGYTYHAMHAYLVQYCGNITWSTSVTPAAAPRRNPKYRGNYEFRLEILQNDEAVDQTFVKLSDEEAVTTGFEFNYDLSKEFNKNRSNIYTLIGTEPAAGNVLPLTDQTTVVPVGVIAKTDGDYTFSIPDGTEGIGVTLIDNETGIRTSLSAVDYTINLSAGTYDDRFLLEISPIKHVATGIETVNEEGVATNGARKIMIDGLLYIVKDGKVFDAQGRQVK